MLYLLNVYWIVFIVLLLFFNIYCFHAFIVSQWGQFARFAPTLGHQKHFIIAKLDDLLQKADKTMTIIDAGCGNGKLLRTLAERFPAHRFIGLEWSLPYFKYCVWSSAKYKNLVFRHQDMFQYDFGCANIIICFLIPKMAGRFGDKAQREMQENCLVISNGLEFPQLELTERSGKFSGIFPQEVFVYKKRQAAE